MKEVLAEVRDSNARMILDTLPVELQASLSVDPPLCVLSCSG